MSTNRIPVPIQNIAVGDIVKVRNGEERTVTKMCENPDDVYPIEGDSDGLFYSWSKTGEFLVEQRTDHDIIEVWREIPQAIEVTAVVAGDGVPKPVESLARRLAATDGISPDALTLIGETMKNGIVTILHSIELQPAWMRYIQQATQTIEQVLQDQGDGWFPIETLDPVATPSVSLWMVDDKFEYLLTNVEFDGFQWVSYDRSEGGRALHMLDGKPTHYRRHAIRPVDRDKPKT